jgi:FMN phosphatase YigB (HAD superfamily)
MVEALVFDAYGTLFDVRSVLNRCEEVFPGHGSNLTRRREIGFVSSNCRDVAGGKAFGFRAYWLNRKNGPLELLGFEPDRIIHSALELVSEVA